MTFKDSLTDDLDEVFINLDEFADTHTLNGDEVTCVAEGLTTDQQILAPKNFSDYQFAYHESIVVHIKSADLAEPLVTGNAVTFDDNDYLVANVTDENGLTTLILEATEV